MSALRDPGLWCACAWILPTLLAGQTVSAGATVQTYSLSGPSDRGIEDVQLITAPFAARWSGRGAEVEVTGAYASGRLTRPGGEYVDLSGPTDTRIMAGYGSGGVSVRAFVTPTTGRASYTAAELSLLGALASDLLPFSLDSWGTGGAFGGELGFSHTRGLWTVTLRGGYVLARPYTPVEGTDLSYRPGDQLRLGATVDARLGSVSVLSVTGRYGHFAGDEAASVNVFQSGDRIEMEASLTTAVGARESVWVHGGVYSRSEGVIGFRPEIPPELIGVADSPGRRLVVLGAAAHAARGRFALLPEVQLRALSSADGIGGGWLASVGAGVDYRVTGGRFGSRLIASPFVSVHLGSVETATDTKSDVRGWEAGLRARWEAGP